ncbi:MAG: MerR family transcriptional regulator [Caldiserica bacterium]|nr:MerR family transcriptional regulator [Caldisericota bacterium]MDH7562054.1 MerR family transcriptional regulator [Caldisericota bacterium]
MQSLKGVSALERTNEKYYTIEEAASKVGVSPRMLRYWEDLGLIFPKRTPGNQRRFSEEEIRILSLINRLIKEYELSTAEIRVIQKLGCKELALTKLKSGQIQEEDDPVWLMILLESLYAKLVGDRTLELLEWTVKKGAKNGQNRERL